MGNKYQLAISIIIFSLASQSAHAGLFDRIAKAVTAPIKAIANGNISDIPKIVMAPATPLIKGAADAIGGSTGQIVKNAINAGPIATMNLANAQFLQTIVAIKGMKAAGVIHSNDECRQISARIADGVGLYNQLVVDVPGQADLTQKLGDAACDTATPAEAAALGTGVTPPSPEAAAMLGQSRGFAGLQYQRKPAAICSVGAVPPLVNPGQFFIMSDLTALNWNPWSGWQQVAQLYLDPTGSYVIRLPLPSATYQLALGSDQRLYFVDFNGTPQMPGPIGFCQ